MKRTVGPARTPAPLAGCWTRSALSASICFGLLACANEQPPAEGEAQALKIATAAGKRLFERAFPNTNGRACASCHVLDEASTLTPANVAARLSTQPDDPLFNRIDADEPDADVLTFEHLKKGLVRVVLPLPDNMDVIDFEGKVVTPADRKVFVWRGVPSVADVALSAPYQLDGRERNLEEQAASAIASHSEGPKVAPLQLELLAKFQREQFSSSRARFVARLLDLGVREEHVPVPEEIFPLSEQEQRGRAVYNAACQACHGGATTDRVTDREVPALLFPALTPEGNVLFDVAPGKPPTPVRRERSNVDFMNAGFGLITYFGQLGLSPAFNASLVMPRYRFRFYKDGTRSEREVDLPPVPVTVSGDPFDPRPAIGADGAPILGPSLVPQAFTTDPGRALVTGDPADWEAFDVPQLRGIARTAPYFHDNSRETLREVVDEYSRFLLPILTPLGLPKLPPEQPGGRAEALSPEQKADLVVFLERL